MQYNFKAQFVPLIQSGRKRQTIRALGKRRPPMPGEPLQLYTGLRTKEAHKLLDPDPLCKTVKPLRIDHGTVYLDGQRLTAGQAFELAQRDGFDSLVDFLKFFQETHGTVFEGILIEWGAPR